MYYPGIRVIFSSLYVFLFHPPVLFFLPLPARPFFLPALIKVLRCPWRNVLALFAERDYRGIWNIRLPRVYAPLSFVDGCVKYRTSRFTEHLV